MIRIDALWACNSPHRHAHGNGTPAGSGGAGVRGPAQASLPLHENVRGPDYFH
jgi:hypothetical protein